jgi:hypothetical protein
VLIEKVKEKQTQLKLSDRDFSTYLGLSHGLWGMIKIGTRQAGTKFLSAIAKNYPELKDDIFTFLQEM